MERSDQADVCGLVVALDFLVRVMLLEQNDGFPAIVLETGVDSLCFSDHFVEELLIARNIRTAGSRDFDERKAAMIRRMKFEKALDTAETLQNAFGVIDAVDAHTEERSFHAEFGAKS